MSYVRGQMPFTQRMRFAAGTWKARRLGAHVGPVAHVDWTTHLVAPSAIRIGAMTEVLRGCTLDGRSASLDGVTIGPRCRLKENCWIACYGGDITLGSQCLVGRNTVLQGHGGIEVGDFSGFGPNCVVLSFEPVYWAADRPFQEQGFITKRTIIGKNVYIGANCTVLGGVHIAPDVLVGAGSIVTRDLESGFAYAGAPARPLHRLEQGARAASVTYH